VQGAKPPALRSEATQARELQAQSNSLQLASQRRVEGASMVGGVFDKLDVRIPARTPYTQAFNSFYQEVRANPKMDPFHSSWYYGAVADLRPYGIEAFLHAHCRFGHGDHKVELLETGKRSLAFVVNEIEQIFDVNALKLEIMRVDLAADVEGVPVWFFQDGLRAAYKQVTNDIERADLLTRMGKGEVQTIYCGRRPNLFRVYNKIAELKLKYSALVRKNGTDSPIRSFEDLYGYPEEGLVLTRVERQIGGSRVPNQISTIELFRKNALDFDPFECLEFLVGGKPEPNPDDYDLTQYLAGIGLRTTVGVMGMQRTRRLINKKSRGNASRVFGKLRDFLPPVSGELVVPSIRELYRESVGRQLAA